MNKSFYPNKVSKLLLHKELLKTLGDFIVYEDIDPNIEKINPNYKGYFSIKPNHYKDNHIKANIMIDKVTHQTNFEGYMFNDRCLLFKQFKRQLIDKKLCIHIANMIQSLGEKYYIYISQDKIDLVTEITKIADENIPHVLTTFKTYFDTAGKLSPGRGAGLFGDTRLSIGYLFNEDLSLSEYMLFEFPLKGFDKIEIYATILNDKIKLMYRQRREDDFSIIEDLLQLENLLDKRFHSKYQSTIKKHLAIKNAELKDEYITLLKMMNI